MQRCLQPVWYRDSPLHSAAASLVLNSLNLSEGACGQKNTEQRRRKKKTQNNWFYILSFTYCLFLYFSFSTPAASSSLCAGIPGGAVCILHLDETHPIVLDCPTSCSLLGFAD